MKQNKQKNDENNSGGWKQMRKMVASDSNEEK